MKIVLVYMHYRSELVLGFGSGLSKINLFELPCFEYNVLFSLIL